MLSSGEQSKEERKREPLGIPESVRMVAGVFIAIGGVTFIAVDGSALWWGLLLFAAWLLLSCVKWPKPNPCIRSLPFVISVRQDLFLGEREIQFIYRDAHGAPSERTMTVKSAYVDNGCMYVTGRCHVRDRPRTFRADRMSDACDLETGEIFSHGQELVQSIANV